MMNAMSNHMTGSNGAHMVPTWSQVWQACEESDAVMAYDKEAKSIQWVDGQWEDFANTHDALNAISAMSAD